MTADGGHSDFDAGQLLADADDVQQAAATGKSAIPQPPHVATRILSLDRRLVPMDARQVAAVSLAGAALVDRIGHRLQRAAVAEWCSRTTSPNVDESEFEVRAEARQGASMQAMRETVDRVEEELARSRASNQC